MTSTATATRTINHLPGVTTTYTSGFGAFTRASSVIPENGVPTDLFIDYNADKHDRVITASADELLNGVTVRVDLSYIETGFAPCTAPSYPEQYGSIYSEDCYDRLYRLTLQDRHDEFIKRLTQQRVFIKIHSAERSHVLAAICEAYERLALEYKLSVHNMSWDWDTLVICAH